MEPDTLSRYTEEVEVINTYMFTPKETQQLEQLLVQHAVANEDNPLSPALNDIEQEVLAVFRTASARIEEHS